ncbi:outer membrane beta-barrel protein [Vibrio sp.]|uniref:outer membrane beta-barrel protein n=1 Tax=Vibrio sp. TaxID=678 RepID=UPI003D0EB372
MKPISAFACAGLLATVSFNASSSPAPTWYLGIDYMQSDILWDNDYNRVKGTVIDAKLEESLTGVSFNLGRVMNDWWAVEMNYSSTGTDSMTDTRYFTGGAGVESYLARFDHDSISIGPKLTWRTDFNMMFYAKPTLHYSWTKTNVNYDNISSVSVGRIEVKEKRTNTHFGLEVGAEYYFSNNYAVHIALQRQYDGLRVVDQFYNDEKFDLDSLKVGLNYYF